VGALVFLLLFAAAVVGRRMLADDEMLAPAALVSLSDRPG
jgi:hypothetical protein